MMDAKNRRRGEVIYARGDEDKGVRRKQRHGVRQDSLVVTHG